jgi:hypothetical protein
VPRGEKGHVGRGVLLLVPDRRKKNARHLGRPNRRAGQGKMGALGLFSFFLFSFFFYLNMALDFRFKTRHAP